MSKYYYHGIGFNLKNAQKMISIINSGGLKSKRKIGMAEYGYNGLDYISLCNKQNEQISKSHCSFSMFVFESFCFIISDKIDAIKTLPCNGNVPLEELYKNSDRYSDMFDEYQVKDEIPLEYIIGIGIPFNKWYIDLNKKEIRDLLLIANKLKLDIVNTSDINFIEKYEKQKVYKLK